MISESLTAQAFREFGEDKCPVCGTWKRPRMSFCQTCYFSLPKEMQRALYRGFGSGYVEAYSEAKDHLLEERRAAGK